MSTIARSSINSKTKICNVLCFNYSICNDRSYHHCDDDRLYIYSEDGLGTDAADAAAAAENSPYCCCKCPHELQEK